MVLALNYASNAIFSKARAMYGKRLKENDYAKLLSCNTVPEILTCLKGIEKYAPLLSKLSDKDIHRVQLEDILRQRLFEEYEALCRYEKTIGEDFAKYTIMKTEISQIMNFLTLLNAGDQSMFSSRMPKYFNRVSSINFSAIATVNTYDEFLTALGKSVYSKILLPFKPAKDEKIKLYEIENALYSHLFKTVYNIIDKTKGAEHNDLKKLFDIDLDLRNFTRIIRLKKYYRMEPEEIKKQLLPFGSLKKKQIQEMCQAEDTKEVFSVMKKTSAGRIMSKFDYDFTCEIPKIALYMESYKRMYFSVNPSVVLVAYHALAEKELENIIHIIEGVRYKVSSEEIKKMLIYK